MLKVYANIVVQRTFFQVLPYLIQTISMLVKHQNVKMEYFLEEAKKTITGSPSLTEQVRYVPYIEMCCNEIRYLKFINKDGNWNLKDESTTGK